MVSSCERVPRVCARVVSSLLLALCVLSSPGAIPQAFAAELDLRVLDARGAGIGDGVVALYRVGRTVPRAAGLKSRLDQRGLSFVPQVLVVQTGTTVSFPNSDNVRHHVYSFSAAKPFELKLYAGDHAATVAFDKQGLVTLGCNIHDWMLGYIYVLDTPYFSKTDRSGTATLGGLPAGDYELRIWHPRLSSPPEFISRKITLGAAPVRRTLSIALRPAEHSNRPPAALVTEADDGAPGP